MSKDTLLPFLLDKTEIRGKIVRLNSSISDILDKQSYPEKISLLISEALVVTSLIGDNLKNSGLVTLQIESEGYIKLIVVDYTFENHIRACADYNKDIDINTISDLNLLFKNARITITVNYGPYTNPYQGIIPFSGASITEAVKNYFNYSDQVNTNIIAFVGKEWVNQNGKNVEKFVAGGIMLQSLPNNNIEEWNEANILTETIQAHEILDQNILLPDLIYSLYHEQGVFVYNSKTISHKCRCSRERAKAILDSIPQTELPELINEAGEIVVTCTFCNKSEVFTDANYVKH